METIAVSSEAVVSRSQTKVLTDDDANEAPVLRLRLKKPKSNKKVGWHEGTVDNEHMGKMKSKCCCIYKKPVSFGESSSEDDEECENCYGHPEKKRKNRKNEEGEDNAAATCDHDHCEVHHHPTND